LATQERANDYLDLVSLKTQLENEIEISKATALDMRVAIAVTDLQSLDNVAINGDELHRTACTINMFALFAAVAEFEAGRSEPSAAKADIRSGIGSSYPPAVATFLIQIFGSWQAGVARAQEMMRGWGMETSVYDHVPLFGDGSQYNLLTPLETNLALVKLYRGEMFSPEWTEYALVQLRDIDQNLNYMLPALLPEAATVAHKMGYHWDYDGWVDNDAGIVTFPSPNGTEVAYSVSYFSEAAPTEHDGYSLGARLSRIIWNWFYQEYGQPTEPMPIETQLQDCLESAGAIWHFDNASKKWSGYQSGQPSQLQSLRELSELMTYVLYASNDCTIQGPSTEIPVVRGWNFFVWQ
jgi:hypothetical protein